MKPSILIVDDDEVMQQTLSDVLKKKGYEIFSVGAGNGALSIIKKNIIISWPIGESGRWDPRIGP